MLHMRVKVATTVYRALCGSHTGCLQAESVLAWLAALRALESSLRAHHGTDRHFQLLVHDWWLPTVHLLVLSVFNGSNYDTSPDEVEK